MKHLIWFVSFFLPTTLLALSTPTPMPEGSYVFTDFSVQVKKRYETVHASTNIGQDRLKELKRNDYTCEDKGGMVFLCSAFLNPHGSEAEIAAKVQKQLAMMPIEFLEPTGEPVLISEAPVLTEWKIPQAVRFNGREHSVYHLVQVPSLEKIFLGQPAEETFVVDDTGSLNYSATFTLTETKMSYIRYFVLAKYQ